MEFPYGHHHHHSSGDANEDGSGRYPPPGTTIPRPGYDYPPPPQHPSYGGAFYQPPPPPHSSYPPPMSDYPPPMSDYPPPMTDYPPPPLPTQHYPSYPTHQQPAVTQETAQTHHSFYPHMPSFPHHHTQHQPGAAAVVPAELASKPTFKVYSKADPNLALTIRDEKVILARVNPSDPYQHWYKDEKYSTRVKDEEGFPCFSLVNKATGLAMKHSFGASHPVQLMPYSSDRLDESIQWTMSKDLGGGYRTIRMVNNIRLNVDAFNGDKKSGGVHDGTTIVLWQWNKGENQLWKITPYCGLQVEISIGVELLPYWSRTAFVLGADNRWTATFPPFVLGAGTVSLSILGTGESQGARYDPETYYPF